MSNHDLIWCEPALENWLRGGESQDNLKFICPPVGFMDRPLVGRFVMAVGLHLTLRLGLTDSIDCFTQDRFSPLLNGIPPLWPFLSSQKTITQPLLPRHWQGQGCQRIITLRVGFSSSRLQGGEREPKHEHDSFYFHISSSSFLFPVCLIPLVPTLLPPFTHFFSSYSPPSFLLCVRVCARASFPVVCKRE